MTELNHDEPDFIIVGWKAKPAAGIHGLFGSTHSEPIRRQLSLPEQE